jgi:hypothetical protein
LGCRSPVVPARFTWAPTGSLRFRVIHPVPLLRPGTPVEPMWSCLGGHIDAAPTCATVKASDDDYFGAHSRSFGARSPTLHALCCCSRARLASGRLAGLTGEGVEPLDHYERFQVIRPSSSPVFLTLHATISSKSSQSATVAQVRSSSISARGTATRQAADHPPSARCLRRTARRDLGSFASRIVSMCAAACESAHGE